MFRTSWEPCQKRPTRSRGVYREARARDFYRTNASSKFGIDAPTASRGAACGHGLGATSTPADSVESVELALAEAALRRAIIDMRGARTKVKQGVDGKATLNAAEWQVEQARRRVSDLRGPC